MAVCVYNSNIQEVEAGSGVLGYIVRPDKTVPGVLE
jgi:hypothetical protein